MKYYDYVDYNELYMNIIFLFIWNIILSYLEIKHQSIKYYSRNDMR